ncbi:unnamed protein product [Trichogramma brassicae]|uniref:Uncharacterized protein n=1 Tax=Trichogramma brassicae TaxID=86971 RepID=A0A6H5IQN5_9HYME|nr:unnamed protein product [Trichogramma brassicae]
MERAWCAARVASTHTRYSLPPNALDTHNTLHSRLSCTTTRLVLAHYSNTPIPLSTKTVQKMRARVDLALLATKVQLILFYDPHSLTSHMSPGTGRSRSHVVLHSREATLVPATIVAAHSHENFELDASMTRRLRASTFAYSATLQKNKFLQCLCAKDFINIRTVA